MTTIDWKLQWNYIEKMMYTDQSSILVWKKTEHFDQRNDKSNMNHTELQ